MLNIPPGVKMCIGIGSARAGTSWLYEILYGHPEVATTRHKESCFFDRYFDRGVTWYQEQFLPVDEQTKLLADVTPSYLPTREVPERIRAVVQNPLILVTLRSPYDRVISSYRMFYQHKIPLEELATGPVLRQEVIENALVADCLDVYFRMFGRENVILFDFRHIRENAAAAAGMLQDLLGLQVQSLPSATVKVNAADQYPVQGLAALRRTVGFYLHKRAPKLLYSLRYTQGGRYLLSKKKPLNEPSGDDRQRLLLGFRDEFEAEIDRMERLIGADLSSWRYEATVG